MNGRLRLRSAPGDDALDIDHAATRQKTGVPHEDNACRGGHCRRIRRQFRRRLDHALGSGPATLPAAGSIFADLTALGYDLGKFRPDYAGPLPLSLSGILAHAVTAAGWRRDSGSAAAKATKSSSGIGRAKRKP